MLVFTVIMPLLSSSPRVYYIIELCGPFPNETWSCYCTLKNVFHPVSGRASSPFSDSSWNAPVCATVFPDFLTVTHSIRHAQTEHTPSSWNWLWSLFSESQKILSELRISIILICSKHHSVQLMSHIRYSTCSKGSVFALFQPWTSLIWRQLNKTWNRHLGS